MPDIPNGLEWNETEKVIARVCTRNSSELLLFAIVFIRCHEYFYTVMNGFHSYFDVFVKAIMCEHKGRPGKCVIIIHLWRHCVYTMSSELIGFHSYFDADCEYNACDLCRISWTSALTTCQPGSSRLHCFFRSVTNSATHGVQGSPVPYSIHVRSYLL